MVLNLKEIQAKLLEQQARKDRARGGSFQGDNNIYPFWNNPEGSSATLRFLPDGDDSNDFFWVERLIIKLPFPGVKGQNDARPVEVQVPCTDMWKPGSCPIAAETRPWWKDPTLEDMARKYWRKKSYLFQGFVTSNPNKDDNPPENPIRRFIINPSVFDIVKSILMRQDLENSPTDYANGRDFYLSKTTKGGYANYASSSWSMKERPLNEDELAAVDKYGLYNLSQFLPKKPDDAALNAMMEMFHASVQEELYDMDRWGQYFRPNGMRADSNAGSADGDGDAVTTSSFSKAVPVAAERTAPVQTRSDASYEPSKTPVSSAADKPKLQSPDEILAAIRARKLGQQ
jgi:gp32 DNA binding protein like